MNKIRLNCLNLLLRQSSICLILRCGNVLNWNILSFTYHLTSISRLVLNLNRLWLVDRILIIWLEIGLHLRLGNTLHYNWLRKDLLRVIRLRLLLLMNLRMTLRVVLKNKRDLTFNILLLKRYFLPLILIGLLIHYFINNY